ncbi:MAG: ATP-binding protein [Deltaproteobacteria bacterium]|nr:ATP-binding protein [Deltaproteobacteria bacterium]
MASAQREPVVPLAPPGRTAPRIDTVAGLKDLVQAHTSESLVLEFKRDWNGRRAPKSEHEVRRKARLEITRDITAFANTWGGTILVGVDEEERDGRKVAGAIRGLSDIDELRKWIHESLNRHARAVPSVDLVTLPVSEGAVLAAHIDASPALCCVWHENAAQYCRRTDHGKAYMQPDEAFRRTLDRSRTIAIALNSALKQVDLQDPVQIMPFSAPPRSPPSGPARLVVSKVGDGYLVVTAFRDSRSSPMITIPFGLIDEVWTTVDNRLALMLRAYLVLEGDDLELRPK